MLLVLRLAELILRVKVDPQLKPDRWLLETIGHLCMHYTFASCHPLNISGTDPPRMTFEIFMADLTLQHISDSLESSVGMVREPSRQLYLEEVKHQEWVQIR